MAPVLTVDKLAHRYGDRLALDQVSFAVEARTVFGLLGPNGGGKTTLFRVLSTLVPPASGQVRLFGLDPVTDRAAVQRRLGVVFQAPSLDRKLTVTENLRHQGHLYGLHGAALRGRIEELLARFSLADRARDLVETLSGGLRRRVEIAKSLLHQPELLLLDEPSTGLDPLARRELMDYLTQLRDRDGVSVLLTTHIMEEADRCDRLALLDRGRLVALDTPAKLKDQVGGDVVTIGTRDPAALRDRLHQRLGLETAIVDRTLRLERSRGHEFIPQLVGAFPGEIDSVSVGKPTLEDAFIHLTGHRFEETAT